MALRRFTLADIAEQPWKNGGGTTREVLGVPVDTDRGRFAWRVSAATIDVDGPFSTFPGVERTMLLLCGDGVRLRGSGIDHRLVAGVPFTCDGSVALDCSLVGRPCLVLNLMVRRSLGRARLDLVTTSTTLGAEHGLLLGVRGDWLVGGESIEPGHGLWWHASPHLWQVQPARSAAELASIRWEP